MRNVVTRKRADQTEALGTDRELQAGSLRILFIATRDWYNPATTGGDNTLWENARYLASVGHRVTFLAARFPGAPSDEMLEGIRVIRLGGVRSLWLRTFLYYVSEGRRRYDVVVAEGFGGSRIPRLVPLYVRVPVITAWHQVHRDLFAAQYPHALAIGLNMMERATAWVHRNTLVQAYTEEGRDSFLSIGFRRENIFVVPVSIREEWFQEPSKVRASTPTVLWIGKLRRYKCPHHVILGFPRIVRDIPDARLVIAGRHDDEQYEEELRGLVRELKLEARVEFRFQITESEKLALLRSAHVFVLPSSVEGFGIVVLEANACGVPVVASSGVPIGAVRDHANGIRYQFGDIAGLSHGVIQILRDPQLQATLSTTSLDFAKQFSWRAVSQRYEEVVRAAAARIPLAPS